MGSGGACCNLRRTHGGSSYQQDRRSWSCGWRKGADNKAVKVPNPAYEEWYARDQQILGCIFSSVSKEVFTQITSAQTAAWAWQEVVNTFIVQRSCLVCQRIYSWHLHDIEGGHDHHWILHQDAVSRWSDGCLQEATNDKKMTPHVTTRRSLQI
jgi:hypothetical protein